MDNGYVWVEKYRPSKFEDIVLDPLNKKMFKNIIEKSYFPNLLFYGPPGTGKTTTIINLINAYQEKQQICKNKELIIHLNASDERGIDIIRNQINSFVNSKTLFHTGMKFVILDEVDYMTKNAQQALRYLLQVYYKTARFCLICNYISKIEIGLQNEFICVRFNKLPSNDIIQLLTNVSICEKLNITQENIISIQKMYKTDIRSMINCMQCNHKNINLYNVIDDNICIILQNKLLNRDKIENIVTYMHSISIKYNIDKINIILYYLKYIIWNEKKYLSSDFLNFVENLVHSKSKNSIYINYFVTKMSQFITKE